MSKNFFEEIKEGIARAFTLPKKQRQALQANPVLVELGAVALAQAQAAANAAIAQRVPDAAAAALLQAALAHVIQNSGIVQALPAAAAAPAAPAAPAPAADPTPPAQG